MELSSALQRLAAEDRLDQLHGSRPRLKQSVSHSTVSKNKKKHLTRRANQVYISIIERNVERARAETSVAGFCLPSSLDHSPLRTAAARHDASSSPDLRASRASRRPRPIILAGARESAGPAADLSAAACGPSVEGYGSRRKGRFARPAAPFICREDCLTAYLISLALAGLLAIAVSEGFE